MQWCSHELIGVELEEEEDDAEYDGHEHQALHHVREHQGHVRQTVRHAVLQQEREPVQHPPIRTTDRVG